MTSLRFTLVACMVTCIVLSSACGDDDSPPPPPVDSGPTDSSTDTGRDTSSPMDAGDAGVDTAPDVSEDVAPDVPPPVDGGTSVALTFGGCDSFASCGGDVVGEFTFTSACVNPDVIVPAMFRICMDSDGEPLYEIRETSGWVSGLVSISESEIRRVVETNTRVDVFLPDDCLPSGINCEFIEDMTGHPCVEERVGCSCRVETNVSIDDAQGYDIDGSTLTMDDEATIEFCVDGDTLTYVNSSARASGGFDPLLYTLTR